MIDKEKRSEPKPYTWEELANALQNMNQSVQMLREIYVRANGKSPEELEPDKSPILAMVEWSRKQAQGGFSKELVVAKLPWVVDTLTVCHGDVAIRDADRRLVGACTSRTLAENEYNAQFIVRTVNAMHNCNIRHPESLSPTIDAVTNLLNRIADKGLDSQETMVALHRMTESMAALFGSNGLKAHADKIADVIASRL